MTDKQFVFLNTGTVGLMTSGGNDMLISAVPDATTKIVSFMIGDTLIETNYDGTEVKVFRHGLLLSDCVKV